MSSTGINDNRIPMDEYNTPVWCIESLIPLIDFNIIETIYDPCCGRKYIVDTLDKWIFGNGLFIGTFGYDIKQGDNYLTDRYKTTNSVCLTNPPYSLAQEFIEKSLRDFDTTIMLLRVNFLGSQKRKDFWEFNPPTNIITLSKRPSFVSTCKMCKSSYHNGDYTYCPNCIETYERKSKLHETTDSTEYAWFVWGKNVLKNNSPFQWV